MHLDKKNLFPQYNAAIDMLANAVSACPDDLWHRDKEFQDFWYIAYHTTFWLDFYLTPSPDDFTPLAPFGLYELDPEGILPERVYTQHEISSYIEHGKQKCETVLGAFTAHTAELPYHFGSIDMTFGELLLYNMRHVQHHTGQLGLLLRQNIDSAPAWIKRSNR